MSSDRYGDSLNPFSESKPKSSKGSDDYNPFDMSSSGHTDSDDEGHRSKKPMAGAKPSSIAGSGDAERSLAAREEALRRKEQELAEREAKLNDTIKQYETSGFHPKNWPFKNYAIEYHDIDGEIPDTMRKPTKELYGLVIGKRETFFFLSFISFIAMHALLTPLPFMVFRRNISRTHANS